MQIAQSLLLLLAFGLTHEAFAGEPTITRCRKKPVKKDAFTREVSVKQAAGRVSICDSNQVRTPSQRLLGSRLCRSMQAKL